MENQKRRTYASDYTGDDSIPAFIAYAIEEFKHHRGISGKEAMEILSNAGALEHLEKYYDVLHQHGEIWLMQELDEFVAIREKLKK